MLSAVQNIREFTYGIDFETFRKDKLRFYALLKNVEIIGEAAYMLTRAFRDSTPEIPWDNMIRMRHVLVHGYASVLPEILWETATKDIETIYPKLLAAYERPLNCTSADSGAGWRVGQSVLEKHGKI